MPGSFLDVTIDGKRVKELLPGDPEADLDSAYKLLELFRVVCSFCSYNCQKPAPYRLVEEHLKRQYQECMTGIRTSEQQAKGVTIDDIGLLEVLVFFRQLDQEPKRLFLAINIVWQSLPHLVMSGEYREDKYREEAT